MIINLIAIGKGMPAWVEQAYQDYAKRLTSGITLKLIELAAPKRSKQANIEKLIEKEAQAIIAAIPPGSCVIALDEHGQQWTTQQLAHELQNWRENYQQVSLLVGGADGLAPQSKQLANNLWSLSKLTLPHPLVRVVLAEQLYRAWSVLQGHPYHRS